MMGEDRKKKVELYAVAWYEIYTRCFKNAGMLKDGKLASEKKWPQTLRDAIQKKLEKQYKGFIWDTYNNYLRDRYSQIRKPLDHQLPKTIIGLYTERIQPLLDYAGIDNAAEFNAGFALVEGGGDDTGNNNIIINPQPVQIRVLHTATPYRAIIDVIRVRDEGNIYIYYNGDFAFEGDKDLFIRKADIRNVGLQVMHGGQAAWLKITYLKKGNQRDVYFAELNTVSKELELIPAALQKHILPPEADSKA